MSPGELEIKPHRITKLKRIESTFDPAEVIKDGYDW
jgi:hypothetical protein